jgi:type II secretory pathway component PulJ
MKPIAIVFAACVATVAAAGCSADGTTESSAQEELTRTKVVDRAMKWVDAKLQYCMAPRGGSNWPQDPACSHYCNREHHAGWDAYRSDCSGLVSFAWELSAPGRVTQEFAPHDNSVSYAIQAKNLKPGDAVNYWQDHIMLFKKWDIQNKRATFIEEPGCSGSIHWAHEFSSDVSISGSSIFVSYNGMTFTAIRYKGI